MRTLEELKACYAKDEDYKNFIKSNKSEEAMYILLGHLDDQLKKMHKIIEGLINK